MTNVGMRVKETLWENPVNLKMMAKSALRGNTMMNLGMTAITAYRLGWGELASATRRQDI